MSESVQNGEAVLNPDKDIIASESRKLREQMQNLVEEGALRITINMEKVELVDSSGIGVLVGIQNALKNKGGELKIVNVSQDIYKMFKIMRLDKHITISQST